MPFPNFHAARVRRPGDFKPGSFRNRGLPNGVQLILGRLKGETTLTEQSFRFPSDKFTPAQARKWLKDHDVKFILFENATGNKSEYWEEFMSSIPSIEKDVRRIYTPSPEQTKIFAKAIKVNAKDVGWVEGYAATFDNIDRQNETFRKGAFLKSIQERVAAGKVKLMAKHFVQGGDVLDLIGTIVEMKEDSFGLWYKGVFASDPMSQAMRTKTAEGHITMNSIGFAPVSWGFKREMHDNKEFEIIEHTESKVLEVTLTVKPVNELATIIASKSLPDALGELEEKFKSDALDPKSRDDLAKLCKAVLASLENQKAQNTDNEGEEVPLDVPPADDAEEEDRSAGLALTRKRNVRQREIDMMKLKRRKGTLTR